MIPARRRSSTRIGSIPRTGEKNANRIAHLAAPPKRAKKAPAAAGTTPDFDLMLVGEPDEEGVDLLLDAVADFLLASVGDQQPTDHPCGRSGAAFQGP